MSPNIAGLNPETRQVIPYSAPGIGFNPVVNPLDFPISGDAPNSPPNPKTAVFFRTLCQRIWATRFSMRTLCQTTGQDCSPLRRFGFQACAGGIRRRHSAASRGLLGEMQEQLSRLDCEVGILHELRHAPWPRGGMGGWVEEGGEGVGRGKRETRLCGAQSQPVQLSSIRFVVRCPNLTRSKVSTLGGGSEDSPEMVVTGVPFKRRMVQTRTPPNARFHVNWLWVANKNQRKPKGGA